jgi:multidrug efflux pump subunit AcrB
MTVKKTDPTYKHDGQDRLLSKLSLAVFDHFRIAAIVWAIVVLFGALSYTTFLKREGFPSVDIPFTIVSGTYLVNDASLVDQQVAKPISDIVLKDSRVKSVQTQSRDAFYSVVVQYNEGTDAAQAAKDLKAKIDTADLPKQAVVTIDSPKFGFTQRGDDAVVSLYRSDGKIGDLHNLADQAEGLSDYIKSKNIPEISTISVIDPFLDGTDPRTNQMVSTQTLFDRYGERAAGVNSFYQSVSVGALKKSGTDVIKLDDEMQAAVREYNANHRSSGYTAVVSASYANDIKAQIGELQRSLFEGLIAVLIVGSIVIAIRASLITVIAMLTVLAGTVGVIYLIGYSLNTITLFSLILCLGLIVDDTIIMVEALDAQRRRLTSAREIVKTATRKISRAMVAATSTAALSFAPLLFVGGILGSFIRAIPVTVITALVVSLVVALVFIPLFARYILLGKKHIGPKTGNDEPAAGVEAAVARFIGRPMVWARHSRKRLVGVGLTAVFLGLAFVVAGGFLFSRVTFNIFPPSKDTNGLSAVITYPAGTTMPQAEGIADRADKIIGKQLGENFKSASYYSNANNRTASLVVNLIPYDERDVRSPQLRDELNAEFANFAGAKVEVNQLDVGPPTSSFTVRIVADDRSASFLLADAVGKYLRTTDIKRPDGTTAKIKEVTVADVDTYARADGKSYIAVTAQFADSDTTTLVTLAQTAIKKEFNSQKLSSFGVSNDAIQYDLGQEQENQDSFKSLALAFPLLLLAIYILLAVQFRSFLQPLLIFMAIPFSLFGITLGLYLTDNAFSFFAMLGFFAIVGLSLKNTILLTDYANQLRRTGTPAVDAAIGALQERFRPLIATSLTAVVSLTPLALTSPFWEGLAVVLIGGLLSSTFLVITVFPYYYLGAEFLRVKTRRRSKR